MALAPLGMPEDDVCAAEIGQHFGADVAGISALWRGMAILSAERDSASGQDSADLREECGRRTNEHLATAGVVSRRRGALLEFMRQHCAIPAQAVHFPIASDEFCPNRHVATPLPGPYHLADTITPALGRVNRPEPAERGPLPPCFRRSAQGRDPTSSRFCSRS